MPDTATDATSTVDVKFISDPAHNIVEEAVAVTPVGIEFTIMLIVDAVLSQPLELVVFIVPVYVPAIVPAGTLIVIDPPVVVPANAWLVTAANVFDGVGDQVML